MYTFLALDAVTSAVLVFALHNKVTTALAMTLFAAQRTRFPD